MARKPKFPNKIITNGDVTDVYIARKGVEYKFTIDTEDLPAGQIVLDKNSYGVIYIKRKPIKFHRHIMKLSPRDKLVIDHIDRNPLNNAKSNLRIVSHAENMKNTKIFTTNKTGIKGVTYIIRKSCRREPCYRAGIEHNGKRYSKQFSTAIYQNAKELAKEQRLAWEKEFERINILEYKLHDH
jgi:hypothetical protein